MILGRSSEDVSVNRNKRMRQQLMRQFFQSIFVCCMKIIQLPRKNDAIREHLQKIYYEGEQKGWDIVYQCYFVEYLQLIFHFIYCTFNSRVSIGLYSFLNILYLVRHHSRTFSHTFLLFSRHDLFQFFEDINNSFKIYLISPTFGLPQDSFFLLLLFSCL